MIALDLKWFLNRIELFSKRFTSSFRFYLNWWNYGCFWHITKLSAILFKLIYIFKIWWTWASELFGIMSKVIPGIGFERSNKYSYRITIQGFNSNFSHEARTKWIQANSHLFWRDPLKIPKHQSRNINPEFEFNKSTKGIMTVQN